MKRQLLSLLAGISAMGPAFWGRNTVGGLAPINHNSVRPSLTRGRAIKGRRHTSQRIRANRRKAHVRAGR